MSPKSVDVPPVAIILKSIILVALPDVFWPPSKIPLTLLLHPDVESRTTLKSPKSIASPCEAIVKYWILPSLPPL